MPEELEITYYNTAGSVAEAWRQLCLNGGYTLYVDADGHLHALRLGVGTGA